MLPSLYISHGSPMLALEPGLSGPALQELAQSLTTPRAIIVMSAHWETSSLRVSSGSKPATWHDFGGFPAQLYNLEYPAPGEPALAATIVTLLNASGLAAELDAERPFDHGTWVPLSLMYPQANIPVVQVSLPSKQGPQLQTKVGAALNKLRAEGYLFIGSGSITHNLGELNWRAGPESIEPWAKDFRDWMVQALTIGDESALHSYRQLAPYAQRSHPSDEHLLPLFFARGAGGEQFSVLHSGFTYGALGMDIYQFA